MTSDTLIAMRLEYSQAMQNEKQRLTHLREQADLVAKNIERLEGAVGTLDELVRMEQEAVNREAAEDDQPGEAEEADAPTN